MTENTKTAWIRAFFKKLDRRYFNLTNEKNKNIIVVLYTLENFVNFSEIFLNRKELISPGIDIDFSRVV